MERLGSSPIESPQTMEQKRTAVMERARTGRLELFKDLYSRIKQAIDEHVPQKVQNAGSSALDVVLGSYKMGAETIAGKTLSGKKLTNEERIMYGLTSLAGIIAQGLGAYGAATGNAEMLKYAGESYAAGWIVFIDLKGPELIGYIQDMIKAAPPALAGILTSFKNILSRYGAEEIKNITGKVENRLGETKTEQKVETIAENQ